MSVVCPWASDFISLGSVSFSVHAVMKMDLIINNLLIFIIINNPGGGVSQIRHINEPETW